jgi:predicted Zn-dependent protease
LNTEYGPVWEHLGVAYQKQRRNKEAVVGVENATRLLPSSYLAWKHLAEAYHSSGRMAEAQRAATRAQRLGGAISKPSKKKA